MSNLTKLQKLVKKYYARSDPAHDFDHILRVYKNAEKICKSEQVDTRLVLSAVLLHDIVSFPKSDKRSKTASTKSAIKAKKILKRFNYTTNEIQIIIDAIENHSFSKNQKPKTHEGQILQDADRLDALGAIGIARTFSVGGGEGRHFYNIEDPFCSKRIPNDKLWTLDHFFKKLLLLEAKMNTPYAKKVAKQRTMILKEFLTDLKDEIQP